MRIPPLLTDFIHDRVCKPNCEKMLTLPCKIEQIKLLINQTQKADMELELGVELPE